MIINMEQNLVMYNLDNIVFFLLVEECKLYVYILYFSEIYNL